MDTSKEYILMCQKAEEIQANWKPQVGDWIAFPKVYNGKGEHPCTCLSEFTEVVGNKNYQVLSYWRCYMLAEANAPSIILKGTNFLASNWVKHIFELENSLLWLPRQDQLQEIVLGTYHFYALPTFFKLFCGNEEMYEGLYTKKGFGLANKFTSLEQFWLAFVMHEKYNKIWNEKDWIKED